MKLVLIFLSCLATDGDTLRCGGERIRLWGLDAPEMRQNGGVEARDHLRGLIQGKAIQCVSPHAKWRFSYRRRVARCFVGNIDLACEMIRAGHGREWVKFSKGYYRGCRP